jgi:DNA-binding NtrC family response regulator
MAARGEFRTDILHRLCVVTLELPPLRERREEIAPLARCFLSHGVGAKQIDAGALARLEERDWPGNIRELRNVLASAALLAQGPCITSRDLGEPARPAAQAAHELASSVPADLINQSLRSRLKSVERAELQKALEATRGNQRLAAALLGVPLRTFERRLRAWRQTTSA